MAVGNSVAAAMAGCRCLSVTVNGIGERAGNTPLEEAAMAVQLSAGLDCGIETRRLSALSALVERASGCALPDRKPVVGKASHRHESGIHCAGLARDARTYEAFPAEAVGSNPREIVFGAQSGRAGLRRFLTDHGVLLREVQVDWVLESVHRLARETKQPVSRETVLELASKEFSTQENLDHILKEVA
jgi:homocitrate synthase NifV